MRREVRLYPSGNRRGRLGNSRGPHGNGAAVWSELRPVSTLDLLFGQSLHFLTDQAQECAPS
jgi:hypothetical protein